MPALRNSWQQFCAASHKLIAVWCMCYLNLKVLVPMIFDVRDQYRHSDVARAVYILCIWVLDADRSSTWRPEQSSTRPSHRRSVQSPQLPATVGAKASMARYDAKYPKIRCIKGCKHETYSRKGSFCVWTRIIAIIIWWYFTLIPLIPSKLVDCLLQTPPPKLGIVLCAHCRALQSGYVQSDAILMHHMLPVTTNIAHRWYLIPVVPHKAVAEVSRIGNL